MKTNKLLPAVIPGGRIPIYPNNTIIRFNEQSMLTVHLQPEVKLDYKPNIPIILHSGIDHFEGDTMSITVLKSRIPNQTGKVYNVKV